MLEPNIEEDVLVIRGRDVVGCGCGADRLNADVREGCCVAGGGEETLEADGGGGGPGDGERSKRSAEADEVKADEVTGVAAVAFCAKEKLSPFDGLAAGLGTCAGAG